MNHYINIKLKTDREMRETELVSKVYTKFHKALVRLDTGKIGISFPERDIKVGKLFRIHSDKESLNELENLNWLGGLDGYCKVSKIKKVDHNVGYQIISRKRPKKSLSQLNRMIKRNFTDKSKIKDYKIKMLQESFEHTFIDVYSSSTNQHVRRFFDFSEIIFEEKSGSFDKFGLSRTATIPVF